MAKCIEGIQLMEISEKEGLDKLFVDICNLHRGVSEESVDFTGIISLVRKNQPEKSLSYNCGVRITRFDSDLFQVSSKRGEFYPLKVSFGIDFIRTLENPYLEAKVSGIESDEHYSHVRFQLK
jgi:hypothetical protein